MKLSIRVVCLLMLAMSLNSGLVCATQTRLRTRYATGHDAVAIPPRLLKEQRQSEGVQDTKVDEQPKKLPNDTAPETPNVNGQEHEEKKNILSNNTTPEMPNGNGQERKTAVGMLAALPELRLDEEEQASFDENTAIALERHETPPEERDVVGDSIFP